MARLTATSRPSPSARRPVRTACSSEPPCGPMPGQRIQTAGSSRRTVSRASRSVAPTTRPTSRPQEQASLATCRYSGTSSVRSRPGPLTRSRCRFPGLGVGGAAEHEHPLAFPGEQGLYRLAAQVRAHRGGIRAVVAEQGFGVGLGGRPDVPTLGVQDHRRVPRNHLQGPLQGGQPRQAEGLVEGDVRLVAAGVGQGLLDQPAVLGLDGGGRVPALLLPQARVQSHAKQAALVAAGALQPGEESLFRAFFSHAFPLVREKKWEPHGSPVREKKGEPFGSPGPRGL